MKKRIRLSSTVTSKLDWVIESIESRTLSIPLLYSVISTQEERRFPARFLVMENEVMHQITNSQCHIFCLTVPFPSPFKTILHIFQIQAPNMTHTIMALALSIISRSKIQPQPAHQLFQNLPTQYQFTNGFTKTFIRKKGVLRYFCDQ